MAASRLTDSQKSELVARYSAGEGSTELAVAYGCSVNTVSRVVKAALPAEEYERLKQERARGARGTAPAAAVSASDPQFNADSPVAGPKPDVELRPVAVLPLDPEVAPEAAPHEVDAVSGAGADDDDSDATLAIDDADDFGDDAGDDEGDDSEGAEELPEIPAVAAASQEPVSCIPLAEAHLPASVYMLVEKTVELEAKPLGEITELGLLPPGEEERQALQLFVNPRNAKRLCGRNQRVIKIPDTRIFERTARYLVAQGISRVVIENGLYSLPGA